MIYQKQCLLAIGVIKMKRPIYTMTVKCKNYRKGHAMMSSNTQSLYKIVDISSPWLQGENKMVTLKIEQVIGWINKI